MRPAKGLLSAVGLNIRSMARQKQIGYADAIRRIKFQEQSVEAALELALEAYEHQPDALLLELIGDLYVSSGHQVAAASVFKAIYYENIPLHVTNLIFAGLPAVRALVDDKNKLLFIPIPKCGSSTVKNYFTAAIYGNTYGELVHFRHPELYRIVTREEMKTTYKDYFRFSVVRDPMSRLVSYYTRNVSNRSLQREALSEVKFNDLVTRPGPRQFAVSFHQYRQFFKDFRHHTDPICGYLDPFKGAVDKIYQMSDLPEIREKLSDIYGRDIKDERSMVSKPKSDEAEVCTKAVEVLRGWYKRDYELYF